MPSAGEVVMEFYRAAQRRDFAKLRTLLADDLVFVGLFETYRGPTAYLAAFTGLLAITTRIDVKTAISEGAQAAIFFELETVAPAAAVTLVAEWHQVHDGKIRRVQSAFDGRPFAAMFEGAKGS